MLLMKLFCYYDWSIPRGGYRSSFWVIDNDFYLTKRLLVGSNMEEKRNEMQNVWIAVSLFQIIDIVHIFQS